MLGDPIRSLWTLSDTGVPYTMLFDLILCVCALCYACRPYPMLVDLILCRCAYIELFLSSPNCANKSFEKDSLLLTL